MTYEDVAHMSEQEIRRNLTRLRGITTFWDEADCREVQLMISLLERALVSAPPP